MLINNNVKDDNDVTIAIDGVEVDCKEINFSDIAAPWTLVHSLGSAEPTGATQGKSATKGDITFSAGEAEKLGLRATLTNTIKFSSIVIQYASKTTEGATIIRSFNPLNADRIIDGIMWGPDKSFRQAGGEILPKYSFIARKTDPAVSV